MNKEIIGRFAIKLYTANNYDNAFDAYYQLVRKTGFDAVCYSYMPQMMTASQLSLSPIIKNAGELYETFLQDYLEKGLLSTDPIIRLVKNGKTETLDWWEEAKKGDFTESEYAQLESMKTQYGIPNGITIPTMTGQRGIAGGSVITTLKGSAYEALKNKHLSTLEIATKMFHDFTLSHPQSLNTFVLPLFPKLTIKEIQVIQYLLTGKPMKGIKEVTDIPPKYAEKLLINIRKKFGNISTNELIHQISVFDIFN